MRKPPFVRNPYNYDVDQISDETGLLCLDPSLAQQHQKDDADINVIVERFGLTGQLPNAITPPQYGDFSQVTDYHSAMNAVIAAQENFMELPAKLRARFDNDPSKLIDFVSNGDNREEAVSLGIIERQSQPQADSAPAEGGGSTVYT